MTKNDEINKISIWPQLGMINKIQKLFKKSQQNVKMEISENLKNPIYDKKWQKITK